MDTLSKYLEERDLQIQIPNNSEVKRIQHGLERVLTLITESAGRKDPRFVGKLIPVGSYFSELKIGLPDEFDFIYELQTLEEVKDFEVMPSGFKGSKNIWRTPTGSPINKKILLKDPSKYTSNIEVNDSTQMLKKIGGKRNNYEYVLDPVGTKNSFYNLVTDVLETFDRSQLPTYLTFDKSENSTFFYGPAITLFFNWNGRLYKNLSISVDITVALKAKKYKEHFDFYNSSNMNIDSCLRKIVNEEIFKHGYHLVPHISDKGHAQWKISTSFLDARVLSRFPRNSTMKQVIRLVKAIKDEHLRYSPSLDLMQNEEAANVLKFCMFYFGEDYNDHHHLVSSYMIKTNVFNICGFASSSEWKNATLSTLYLLTLVFVYKTISTGSLTNFYISRQKLKLPEHGDILPGFHKIFQDTYNILGSDLEFLQEDEEGMELETDQETERPQRRVESYELEKRPFTNIGALFFFRQTKQIIEENFTICWKCENTPLNQY